MSKSPRCLAEISPVVAEGVECFGCPTKVLLISWMGGWVKPLYFGEITIAQSIYIYILTVIYNCTLSPEFGDVT
jgi:hypothetical protein